MSITIGDEQWNKVANLAKYVHLQEVGTFQIITSQNINYFTPKQ